MVVVHPQRYHQQLPSHSGIIPFPGPSSQMCDFCDRGRADRTRRALNHQYFLLQHAHTGWDCVLCSENQWGVVPALPEALLPVVLNNWPLLAKGCQSGAQHSPPFMLSLIVSAFLSSVFDVVHTLGAVSRLTQFWTFCSGSRLLLAHRDCFCDHQVSLY